MWIWEKSVVKLLGVSALQLWQWALLRTFGAVRMRKEFGLRCAAKTNYRTENYQLARHILR